MKLTKKDIIDVAKEDSSIYARYGIKFTPSKSKFTLNNYTISIVLSKYGYDELFGLNFCLRATYDHIPKNISGNLVYMAKDQIIFDANPRNMYINDKELKNKVYSLYNNPKRFSSQMLFSAKSKEDIRAILSFSFEYLSKLITEANSNRHKSGENKG